MTLPADHPVTARPGAVPRTPHVVVVGGGVTGLSAAARALESGARVTLVESTGRLGGKIATERLDGFVVEAGPDTLFAGQPAVGRLLSDLGLGPRLVAPRKSGVGYMLRRGELVPIPDGLAVMVPQRLRPILFSRLLSLPGRARAALEIIVPRRREPDDEPLETFVTRRLGRQAYQRLAEPLVGGIHHGDVSTLSVAATFPHLVADETRYGSLARAVLHRRYLRWKHRHDSRSPPTTTPPAPPLAAPVTGMAELVEALESRLRADGAQLLVGEPVLGVHPGARADGADGRPGYRVVTSRGSVDADALILAVPAAHAGRICRPLDDELADRLERLPTTGTTSVSLGFRDGDLTEFADVRSCTVPAVERRRMRNLTVASHRYAGRAPHGATLLRVVLHQAPPDDDAAVLIARAELTSILGLDAVPVLARVHRWDGAMPRYTVGHRARVAQIRERLTAWPGLAVAGSPYDGAAISDCIGSGQGAVRTVLTTSGTDPSADTAMTG